MDDEAVSPVLGVILLIAIAVALAGTVLLIVGEFQQEEKLESVQFAGQTDDTSDEWRVVRGSDAGVSLAHLQWRGEDGVRYALESPATAASPMVPTEWTVLGGDERLGGGDVISFCGDAGPVGEWTFGFRASESGTLLGSYKLGTIAPCL